MIDLLSWTCQS